MWLALMRANATHYSIVHVWPRGYKTTISSAREIKLRAQVAWIAINIYLFWTTYNQYKYAPKYFYLHQMLGAGLCVGRGTAAVLNLNCGVILLPMCRCSVTLLRQIKCLRRTQRMLLDHCKGFHCTCAAIIVISSIVHTFAHFVNAENLSAHYNTVYRDLNVAKKPREDPMRILLFTVPGATGMIMMLLLVLIVSSSTHVIRVHSYNLFWYSHRLYILFYIFFLSHAVRGILKEQNNIGRHLPGCDFNNSSFPWPIPETYDELSQICQEEPRFQTASPKSWLWVSGPLAIYICDILCRCIRATSLSAHVTGVVKHPAHITQIRMSKRGISIKPGQYVLLQCPAISTFEWHPFTISKVPTPVSPDLTIHMKTLGDWSGQLDAYLSEKRVGDGLSLIYPDYLEKVYIDGPFASPFEDVLRYDVSLCVAGGMGITPFAAILDYVKKLSHRDVGTRLRPERLYLMWVAREADTFLCFDELLQDVHTHFWERNMPDFLELRLYCTRRPKQTERESRTDSDVEMNSSFLSKRLRYGRPDWDTVLHRIAESHTRCDIGVFSCGPKALNTDVRMWCSRVRHNGARFHVYNESF